MSNAFCKDGGASHLNNHSAPTGAPPLLIEVTLCYETARAGETSETFWYLNDGNLSKAALIELRNIVSDRGPIIAAKYGLPQLSPVFTPEQADQHHHPYSVLAALQGHHRLPEHANIPLLDDLASFSAIYPHLLEDTSCEAYLAMKHNYHTNRAKVLLDEFAVHFAELNQDGSLLRPLRQALNGNKKA